MKYKDLTKEQKKYFFTVLGTYFIIGLATLIFFCSSLINDREEIEHAWWSHLEEDQETKQALDKISKDATEIRVGTYWENLKEINLKSSFFKSDILVWFNWDGDPDLDPANHFRVYNGSIGKKELVKEYHEGNKNYQLVRMDLTVYRSFNSRRFPLESHQLRFYIESDIPSDKAVFVVDKASSGVNRNINITGFKFLRHAVAQSAYKYDSTHGDPEISHEYVSSEIMTQMEITRDGFGLYAKCFIALVGTITWVLIAMYLCTFQHIDPIGLIPGALFGTVTNIMVGANLLPDALSLGLLEYVNIWGILTILAVTIAIIIVNSIRNNYDNKDYAHFLAFAMYLVILGFTIAGQLALPFSAYIIR